MKKIKPILCLILLWVYMPVDAQFSDPARWDELIETENTSERDTFLIIQFDEPLENYPNITQSQGVGIKDAAADKIEGQSDNHSLYMIRGSEIQVQLNPPSGYTNTGISMAVGGIRLDRSTILTIKTKAGEGIVPSFHLQPRATFHPINFSNTNPWIKPENLPNLNNPVVFRASEYVTITFTEGKTESRFALDYILGYGEIYSHSLSRLAGNWEDHVMWSHGSPGRNRNALIRFPVQVDKFIQCKDIYLHQGSIVVNHDASLQCESLTMIDDQSALYIQGELKAGKQVTVSKRFDAGKWSFTSFPFDVYISGLDPDFTLKDETNRAGGNFIYVMEYDSEKRSLTKKTEGNWKTISQSHPYHIPLFEKGKGYLVAIDEYAAKQTLSFSSPTGKTVIFDSNNTHIPIRVHGTDGQAGDLHTGWQLCGNPLPSPLSLKQIAVNLSLDGYIYYYSGTGYERLAIGSDYLIPSFSAFFVKARETTDMQIHSIGETSGGKTIEPGLPDDRLSEPSFSENLIYKTGAEENESLYRIKNNYLYIYNMPDKGSVRVLNMSGRTVFSHTLKTGNSTYHLPLEQGIYIIDIRSGSFQAQDKFIIN